MTNIQSVSNGYIVTTCSGDVYVAKTLMEAATLSGEYIPRGDYVVYAHDKGVSNLSEIRRLWHDGQKISAIKELRACFEPRFNLLEAKQLLEELCA